MGRGTPARQGYPYRVHAKIGWMRSTKPFAALVRLKADALLIAPDGLFIFRAAQIARSRPAMPSGDTSAVRPGRWWRRELGGQIRPTACGALASMPAARSRARSRPTCRSCNRPNFELVINLSAAGRAWPRRASNAALATAD